MYNGSVLPRRTRGISSRAHVCCDRSNIKVWSALLVLLVAAPLWIMPLSTPVFADLVVVMHDDAAVNTAVRAITANVPDARVVEYGSLDYALTIHRAMGRVVWVSHGSKEGILASRHVLSWKEFSSRLDMTPGKDIVLACNSANVYQFIPSRAEVVGIDGLVDAGLGGLVAAYLLSPTKDVLSQVMMRIDDILSGQSVVRLLSPVEITLSVWWDFLVPHGTVKVTFNNLAIFSFMNIAIACGLFGSLWNAIGVVLDCFTVSFGTALLDWIWPVLVKPALQVLFSAMFGVMSPIIEAAKSVLLGLASMFVIQALVSMITYMFTNVLVPFLTQLGYGWLKYPINVILIKEIKHALTGPIARSLAAHTSLELGFADALNGIGFGVMKSIVIAGLETAIDLFCYTWASKLTHTWTTTF